MKIKADGSCTARALKLITAAVTSFFFSCPLYATDLSDLRWNSAESGWGANVSQQERVLFITFFVYDQSGRPYWVVAPDTQFQGAGAAQTLIFSGPLYQTTGPWFASPSFNAGAVSPTQVGTVTFTLETVNTARITYSINGAAVTKAITRQTFRVNSNVPGSYLGAMMKTTDSCASAANQRDEFFIPILISLSGNTARLTLQSTTATCDFTGTYVQAGRMGGFSGPVICVPAATPATATFFEIEATNSGFSARYTSTSSNGCIVTGHVAGSRR